MSAARDIEAWAHHDDARKHLIRLAVMRVVAMNGARPPPPQADDVHTLTQKCLNYEIAISKLKQEWNTKEKLHESQVERLNDELGKLKSRLSLRPATAPPLRASVPSAGLSFRTSPYMSRIMATKPATNFLSPTANSLQKSIFASGSKSSILSPIQQRKNPNPPRGSYTTARTFANMISKPKNKTLLPKTPVQANTLSLQLDKAIATKTSPTKTPSRMSFVENFDNSDKSPSPEFTPTKRAPAGDLFDHKDKEVSLDQLLSTSFHPQDENPEANSTKLAESEETPEANSTSIADAETAPESESDVFTSANSTVNTFKKKKTSRKLNLGGPVEQAAKRLNIDNDASSLDYYKDKNFEADESPNKNSVHAAPAFEKKKGKVFKIN